jgi:hypothetical protein
MLGSHDAAAAVHHFGFEFGFEGLHLAQHGQAAGRAAHLVLELVEHFVQPLSGGPESWVVLSRCGVHMHDGSVGFLDIIIVIADDLG